MDKIEAMKKWRYVKMTATITTKGGKFNVNHRKESHFCTQYSAIVFDGGKFYEPVTLRLYATSSTVFACVWLSGKNVWNNGSGKAGGYGYHRASAAAGEAIRNAGVELSEDIDGRGDFAIKEAIKAIAVSLYGKNANIHIVESYG